MLLRTGRHPFRRDEEPSRPLMINYVSVSASAQSFVKVSVHSKVIEEVFVGPYSPHTWWGNNPLMTDDDTKPGDYITIEVGPNAIMRIESNLQYVGKQ